MQKDCRQRNHEIVQLCRAGESTKVVARQFRITKSRVRQILDRDARDRAAAQRVTRLTEEFRIVDDLDRTWTVEDLLDALSLPTPTRRALESHCAGNAVPTKRVSLGVLMNLVVAPTPKLQDYLAPTQNGQWSLPFAASY